MPHIAVSMYPGRDAGTKEALAKKIHDLVAEELQVPSHVVSVSVEDVPKENWAESMKKYSDDVMFVKPGV